MHLTIDDPDYLFQPDNYFVQFLETICDAGILIDANERIIYLSRKAFPHIRQAEQRQALIGQKITDYEKISPFRDVLRTGVPVKGFVLKNELGKTNISHIFPIYYREQIAGLLCVLAFDDLNYIKKILNQMNDQHQHQLSREIYHKISQTEAKYTLNDFIGQTPQVQHLISTCEKAARTDYPVLITGETGTGKEIIAHSIHACSSSGLLTPFVRINCTAIPANLLESELFGHEKGAFTGASSTKKGKFEMAENGTILLDEIEAMDMMLQGKLLRVLEEREFERVGGHHLIPLRARIIASTNQSLYQMVQNGSFRPDLYYRLNIIEIKIPALRDRTEDIPLLVEHFIENSHFHYRLTPEAIELLSSYSWPGNVRELRNALIKLSVLYDDPVMTRSHLENVLESGASIIQMPSSSPVVNVQPQLQTPLSEAEQITEVLKASHYNIQKSAKQLGISRTTLYNKIARYQITIPR